MSSRRVRWPVIAGVIVAWLVPAGGMAKEVKGSGTATYIPMTSETDKLADGRTLQRDHLKGIVLANDPSVSIHKAVQDCHGTTLIGPKGLEMSSGYCDGIDQSGDLWWIWWRQTPKAHDWGFVGGTGKYKGVEGGGTAVSDPPNRDGSFVIEWKGSWKTQ